MSGDLGGLIHRADGHLFAADKLSIGYADITAEEFLVMQLIAVERNRLEAEKVKR